MISLGQIPECWKGKPCVYVLRLKDGSRYVGFSSDIYKRVKDQRRGNGAHIVRKLAVDFLESVEPCATVEEAKTLCTRISEDYRNAGRSVHGRTTNAS